MTLLTTNNNSIISHSNNFLPEEKLLLLVSRKKLSELNLIEIRNIITKNNIGWENFICLAKNHAVLPLAADNLQKYCADILPEKIKFVLKQEFRNNGIRNVYLAREFIKILELLEENNIKYIPFKGLTLAMSIYEDISLRQFNDLDILIDKEDLFKLRNLFLANGGTIYFSKKSLTETQDQFFIKSSIVHNFTHCKAFSFAFKKKTVILDVHWEMFAPFFPIDLSMSYLADNLSEIEIFNKKILILSPEDNLILLCGHGSKDFWNKLSRIVDIAELIKIHNDLQWDLVIEKAKEKRVLRLLLIGVYLASQLQDISLPELIFEEIEKEPKVITISMIIYNSFFARPYFEESRVKTIFERMKYREKLRDKILILSYPLFSPSYKEWCIFLPQEYPIIFYYLIRPIRLLIKYLNVFKNQ